MEHQCESFDELESKYYTLVPFDDNDPDVMWGKNKEDFHASDSPSCKPESSESDRGNLENLTPQEETNALSLSLLELSATSSTKKHSRWNQEPVGGDKSTDEFKEIIRRRRQSSFASSSSSTENDTIYPRNDYPNNWENASAQPPTQRWSYSSETPSSYRPNSQNKRRNEASHSLSFRSEPFGNSRNSSRESFESPYKKLKTARRSLDSGQVMPCHKGYQLLGDSQLVRFSEQLLGCKRFVTYSETQSRRIGYCVSGQKIRDLKERISNRELRLAEKLIMLIGTNDMIYDTDLELMQQDYRSLLSTLKETAKRIVILTVPPVAKLAHHGRHMSKLKRFNQLVTSCADGTQVFAVDLASVFISYSDTVSAQYFEEVYGNRRRANSKVDLIHLNRAGFKMMSTVLDVGYFDKYPL